MVRLYERAPEGLRDSEREGLVRRAADGNNVRYGTNLSFRRFSANQDVDNQSPNCEASLYLNFKEVNLEEDEEGSLWRVYVVQAEVGWPSWGSTEPDLAGQRLALMNEVCAFAKKVNEQFSEEVWCLSLSKERRAEIAQQNDRKRAEDAVRKVVLANRKGMKVGQERPVTQEEHGIPFGRYDVIGFDHKRYTAFVDSKHSFYFTRTA